MKTTCLAGILVGAVLVGAPPTLAQDKGKTEAADKPVCYIATGLLQEALKALYAATPLAKELGPKALAILVFPEVTKAGLGIGGQYGEGTLLTKGSASAYYKTTGASIGLQAGGQQFAYARHARDVEAARVLLRQRDQLVAHRGALAVDPTELVLESLQHGRVV